jgi:CMP-N,N'-diacetyllegionaminic acid synthase
MEKILALVPARGGSKSIPHKNIVPLGNKPLIAYVLDTLQRSRYINKVVVSTDDTQIAEVAEKAGAEVPFLRPREISQDSSPAMPLIFHAVKALQEMQNYVPDVIVFLQPTSPFTRVGQIDSAIELLRESNADAVTTVVEAPHVFHPYNIRQVNADGTVNFFMPKEHDLYPTRQAKPKFYAFGNVYVLKHQTLTNYGNLYGERCIPLVVDAVSAFDINDPVDLAIAECLLKLEQQNENRS